MSQAHYNCITLHYITLQLLHYCITLIVSDYITLQLLHKWIQLHYINSVTLTKALRWSDPLQSGLSQLSITLLLDLGPCGVKRKKYLCKISKEIYHSTVKKYTIVEKWIQIILSTVHKCSSDWRWHWRQKKAPVFRGSSASTRPISTFWHP